VEVCLIKGSYLDIRSVRDDLCNRLESVLKERPKLNLCSYVLNVLSTKIEERMINDSMVHIKMLSPLEVHTTDENHHSYFFTPLDKDFSIQINANFQRKWTAYTGNPPIGGIELTAINVGAKDKYITTYKNMYINGWRGTYILTGNPEYLNFLYYCGLGARNSDGFGMFEII